MRLGPGSLTSLVTTTRILRQSRLIDGLPLRLGMTALRSGPSDEICAIGLERLDNAVRRFVTGDRRIGTLFLS